VVKSNKFLKITGILMIIGGSFTILFGTIIILFGIFLESAGLLSTIDLPNTFGLFAEIILGALVAGGIVQLITGIIGVKNAKKPENANICLLFGAITALIFIAPQVLTSVGSGNAGNFNAAGVITGMLIPAFYLIGAVQLKEKDKHDYEKVIKPEMAVIVKFFAKRKEKIFEILFTFILCGIIGWLFETIEVWVHYGNLTTRGIFFISRIYDFPVIWGLPYILMYGIGGAILIWCFKPLAKEPIRLFFIGMLVLTLFEYATSVLCEDLLNVSLWDYSNMFMNFQGRVCLRSSLAWGVLSVISVKLFAPLFHRLYNEFNLKLHLHVVTIILLVYIIVCYILRSTLGLNPLT